MEKHENTQRDKNSFFYDPLRNEGYYWLRTSLNEISKISETIQAFDVIVRIKQSKFFSSNCVNFSASFLP